ncbi:MAG TPA: hypothetical protein PLH22_00505 [Candidatus Colwellbacteria bacterium]|nr:hypothetical protein [Candidatus Colwellbacteria bacterium]
MQFYFGLAILAFMEGALVYKRSFLKKYAKAIFVFAIAAVFLVSLYYSFDLYSAWKTNPVTAAMLPPSTPIDYFLFYVFMWAFASYVVSLVAALAFLAVLKISNKKSGEKYFESEEPWMAGTAIFLCGHPGWIVYMASLIVIYLLIHLFFRIKNRSKKDDRLPLYHLWIPIALLTLLLCEFWLPSVWPFWSKLLL